MPQNAENRVSDDLKFQSCPGEDVIEPPLLKTWIRARYNSVGLVSMDLSKAFDILPFDFMTGKLQRYADEANFRQRDHLSGDRSVNNQFKTRCGVFS